MIVDNSFYFSRIKQQDGSYLRISRNGMKAFYINGDGKKIYALNLKYDKGINWQKYQVSPFLA